MPGGTAGAEVVAVAAAAVTVKIQSGVSTATQVLAAVSASAAALALLSASITGTAGTAQVSTSLPLLVTGDIAQRIAEGDRKIDARLAGLEISLPFAANPPAIQDISVAYARYACFRDLYASGDPSKGNPQADRYLKEYEDLWTQLKEGWAKLVDSSGAQVAATKFSVLTIGYPQPSRNQDMYPNFPSGPYPDPPGVDWP